MRLLKQTSIKQRLTFIIMSISGVSVLLTTFLISIIGVNELRSNAINQLHNAALVAGKSNEASLFFDDYNNIKDSLNGFSANPDVLQLCLYDAQSSIGETINKQVGRYTKNDVAVLKDCPQDMAEQTLVSAQSIALMRPVVSDGALIGYVYMESAWGGIDHYIEQQIMLAVVAYCASMLAAYLLMKRVRD
jgi:Periplasmic sensor domain